MKDADIAQKKFITKFYMETDPKSLSETAIVLLTMFTQKSVSSSTSLIESSSSVQYGSPEEILKIKQWDKMLEVVMNEYLQKIEGMKAETEGKKAEADIKKSQARTAKVDADKAEKDAEFYK